MLEPAVAELGLLFPSADDFHDGVDPERNARFMGDEFNGIDGFPFASLALNRVPVCDALVSLASTLLGTDDIRLYSAEVWGKYEGAADYDQDLHRDYLNHTILVPSSDPAFRQVELFVFLCDVTVELGAPRMVPRSDVTDALPTKPNFFPRSDPSHDPSNDGGFVSSRGRPELYDVEVPATGPAGTVVAFQPQTVHRGSAITQPRGARSPCTSTTGRRQPSGPTATPGPTAATTRTGTSSSSRPMPGSWSSSASRRPDTRTGRPRP